MTGADEAKLGLKLSPTEKLCLRIRQILSLQKICVCVSSNQCNPVSIMRVILSRRVKLSTNMRTRMFT